jgi:signal transduction histidine kinase
MAHGATRNIMPLTAISQPAPAAAAPKPGPFVARGFRRLLAQLQRLSSRQWRIAATAAVLALLAGLALVLDQAARREQSRHAQALLRLTSSAVAFELRQALLHLNDERLPRAAADATGAVFVTDANGRWRARDDATGGALRELQDTVSVDAARPTLLATPSGHLVLVHSTHPSRTAAVVLDFGSLAERYGLPAGDALRAEVQVAALRLDEQRRWQEPTSVTVAIAGRAGAGTAPALAAEAVAVDGIPAVQTRVAAAAPPLLARELLPLPLALAAAFLLVAALAYLWSSLAAMRAVSGTLLSHLEMVSKAFTSGVSIWRRDANGRMLMRWRDEGWTYSAEADTLEGIGSILHPDDCAAVIEGFRACVQGPVGALHVGEYRALADDGTYHRYSTKRIKVLNSAGEAEVVGVTLDLTNWLRSQPLSESIERISGAMDALFWTAQRDGTVEFHGPPDRLARRGGRGPHALSQLFETICDEDRAAVREGFEASLRNGSAWRGIFRLRTRSGRIRTLQVAAAPLHDFNGRYQGLFGLTLDVTDPIKDRLALEAARATSEANGRYIRHLSQEVQSPLHRMSAIVELLNNPANGDETVRRRWLHELSRTSRYAVQVVGEMLEFLQLSERHAAVTPRSLEVRQPVREAVAAASRAAARRGQRLVLTTALDDTGQLAWADPYALVRTLDILLSNASRYSPEGSRIDVRLYVDGAHACIEVQDQGPGLAPGDLERIGTPFFRAASTAKATEGTGLGLSIARELVKAMGGQLHHENATGANGAVLGLRAVVRLPVHPLLALAA